jgi:hypothetical protein
VSAYDVSKLVSKLRRKVIRQRDLRAGQAVSCRAALERLKAGSSPGEASAAKFYPKKASDRISPSERREQVAPDVQPVHLALHAVG